jgi:polyvinyl alcohol dehydrogenase (cytochrome)
MLQTRGGWCSVSAQKIVFVGEINSMKEIRTSFGAVTLVLAVALLIVAAAPLTAQDWPMFGQNLGNTASTTQTDISTKTVSKLMPKWTFTAGGDISARATVVNGVAYFPDWGGNLWAINTSNGRVVWSHQISDYSNPQAYIVPGTVSRTSPTVANGVLYIGTQYVSAGPSGWLLAVNAGTGQLLWATQPDTSNPFPVITSSPSVANGVVFVGMTSNEEGTAANPYYPCCSARGSLVALNASTGAKLWQTFTAPPGYSGANIWGSSPVVDASRNTVFVSTGDNYSHPTDPAYLACISAGGTEPSCLPNYDHADSIIALDTGDGHVKWATRMLIWHQLYAVDGSDDWNVGCIVPPHTNCPLNPTGPDYDFGSGPNELTYQTSTGPVTIIGAGQKSGIYYALNPDTGALLWQTQVGPGSALGGMEWGSATDGKRIYVAISNSNHIAYLAGNAGSWAALDPATGRILWQTADPNGAIDLGPVTVANGVVYAPSMAGSATAPTMLALDAASGHILWGYAAGSSVVAGATVLQDTVYWGSVYSRFGLGTGNNKFYAFTPNGT